MAPTKALILFLSAAAASNPSAGAFSFVGVHSGGSGAVTGGSSGTGRVSGHLGAHPQHQCSLIERGGRGKKRRFSGSRGRWTEVLWTTASATFSGLPSTTRSLDGRRSSTSGSMPMGWGTKGQGLPTCAHSTALSMVRRGGGAMEEVYEFDLEDFDFDRLDLFTEAVTEAKKDGKVAAEKLVFDCSHSKWVLLQMAWDRGVRMFTHDSAAMVGDLSDISPDGSLCMFTGPLQSKLVKRLAKTEKLYSINVADKDTAIRVRDALAEERERLAAKQLKRVSKARERFLVGDGATEADRPPPQGSVDRIIRVFIPFTAESSIDEVSDLATLIAGLGEGLVVGGLWAGDDLGLDSAWKTFTEVKSQARLRDAKLVVPSTDRKEYRRFVQKVVGEQNKNDLFWRFASD